MGKKKRILICPLDWGLGHATRCIPIIKDLMGLKVEVILGADGAPLDLLRQEFPQLPYVQIPGYNIKYPRKKTALPFRMLVSMPGFIQKIKAEHRDLERFIDKIGIDGVISDNRYGLWTREVPCALMTHQLHIQAPFPANKLLWKTLRYYLAQFDECWVPDEEGDQENQGLSGTLSHGPPLPSNLHYLGPLSRFEYHQPKSQKGPDLTVLLSGPEPQRSHFEKKVLEQLHSLPELQTTLIRGLPGETSPLKDLPNHVKVHNHLRATEMGGLLASSSMILCRPGYSTLIDLATLNKNAILIPTPGQTEQEYLGKYHQDQGHFICQSQKQLDLPKALEKAKKFSGLQNPSHRENRLKTLKEFLAKC